jgi:ribosomal-protein-alanine N-acetyltransferase
MSSTKKAVPTHLRWCIRRDMPEVVAIEERSFGRLAWGEDDLIEALRVRSNVGMVAERDERIVGHMLYELRSGRIHLLRLVVHPEHRSSGVGTAFLEKLVGKLTWQRRRRITVAVRETWLHAQQFLAAKQFRATGLRRGYYHDTGEDAIWMERILARPEQQEKAAT